MTVPRSKELASPCICFVTSSDLVKERPLRGFAAVMRADVVRVQGVVELDPDANPNIAAKLRSHRDLLIILEDGQVWGAAETKAYGHAKVLAFRHAVPNNEEDLAALSAYQALCFSAERNILASPLLRFCVNELLRPAPPLDFHRLFRWAYSSCELELNGLVNAELGSGAVSISEALASRDMQRARNEIRASLQQFDLLAGKLTCYSDGLLSGHSFVGDPSPDDGFMLLDAVQASTAQLKVLELSENGGFRLGLFDKLSHEARKQREFVLLNPCRLSMRGNLLGKTSLG